jgi:hypothetical protein
MINQLCIYTRENINNTFQSALTCHNGLDGAIFNFSKYFSSTNKNEFSLQKELPYALELLKLQTRLEYDEKIPVQWMIFILL